MLKPQENKQTFIKNRAVKWTKGKQTQIIRGKKANLERFTPGL